MSNARKKSREFRRKLDDGADLDLQSIRTKLSQRTIHTISDLWAEYHIDALPRKKCAKFENNLWHKHFEEHLGPIDVRSFTDLLNLVEASHIF